MKIALILCTILVSSALTPHTGAAPQNSTDRPYSVQGTIATNRMGDAQSTFLRSANHIQGSATGPKRELPSDIAAAVADVLLNDRTWVGQPGVYASRAWPLPFHPTIRFTLYHGPERESLPKIDIEIDPMSQQLHTMAWGFNVPHGYEQFANYALDAPQVTALLKKAFPQEAEVQALTAIRPPEPVATETIPATASVRIAALHTGMTRADLLKLFRTEGGLSNRFRRSYIYQGATKADANFVPDHGFVKINAEFMPRAAHLKWIEGAGTLIDPEEQYRFDALSEQPDDVIVRLSTPYLGMETSD